MLLHSLTNAIAYIYVTRYTVANRNTTNVEMFIFADMVKSAKEN